MRADPAYFLGGILQAQEGTLRKAAVHEFVKSEEGTRALLAIVLREVEGARCQLHWVFSVTGCGSPWTAPTPTHALTDAEMALIGFETSYFPHISTRVSLIFASELRSSIAPRRRGT
jgi:hypothetical protein